MTTPKYIAIRIVAPNDRNGNPRRGWIIHRVEEGGAERVWTKKIGFVDEGYSGTGALLTWQQQAQVNFVEISTDIDVSPAFYNRIKKEKWTR